MAWRAAGRCRRPARPTPPITSRRAGRLRVSAPSCSSSGWLERRCGRLGRVPPHEHRPRAGPPGGGDQRVGRHPAAQQPHRGPLLGQRRGQRVQRQGVLLVRGAGQQHRTAGHRPRQERPVAAQRVHDRLGEDVSTSTSMPARTQRMPIEASTGRSTSFQVRTAPRLTSRSPSWLVAASASSRLAARASPRTSGEAPGTASTRPPGPPPCLIRPAMPARGDRPTDGAPAARTDTEPCSACWPSTVRAAAAGVWPRLTSSCMRCNRARSASV